MGEGDYVELHCHSAFSLGDGASTPETLAARAAELGYASLALTDHDDVGGAVRFSKACAEVGIRPVFGAEVTLSDRSHLTLIVENPAGWGNLCTLVTKGRMTGRRGAPGVAFDDLAAHSAGLVALTVRPPAGHAGGGAPPGAPAPLRRVVPPAAGRDGAPLAARAGRRPPHARDRRAVRGLLLLRQGRPGPSALRRPRAVGG